MVPKFPVSVKALIERDGKFLMIEGEWDGQPGLAFPGGLVEEGESLDRALVREVKEETGLLVEPVRLAFAQKYSHPRGGENVGIYYRARLSGGKPELGGERNARFTGLKWLSPREMPEWARKIIEISL